MHKMNYWSMHAYICKTIHILVHSMCTCIAASLKNENTLLYVVNSIKLPWLGKKFQNPMLQKEVYYIEKYTLF